jgi:hypothetical protein
VLTSSIWIENTHEEKILYIENNNNVCNHSTTDFMQQITRNTQKQYTHNKTHIDSNNSSNKTQQQTTQRQINISGKYVS